MNHQLSAIGFVLAVLVVTGCEYEVTQHSTMDGSLPSKPDTLHPPTRSEVVGKWKWGVRQDWPEVGLVVELGSDGRAFGVKLADYGSPYEGGFKWEYDGTAVRFSSTDGSTVYDEYPLHRINRNMICWERCDVVMQRVQ